jgi:hypothetical protein
MTRWVALYYGGRYVPPRKKALGFLFVTTAVPKRLDVVQQQLGIDRTVEQNELSTD